MDCRQALTYRSTLYTGTTTDIKAPWVNLDAII